MHRTPSRFSDLRASRSANSGRPWIRGVAILGVLTALFAVAQPPQKAPDPEGSNPAAETDHLQDKGAPIEAGNTERKRQIAEETYRLLELATQLKVEVDKTSKDTLSINVIRKAESIEKLAKGVKEKMKLTEAR